MDRRRFLKSLLAVPAALAGSAVAEAQPPCADILLLETVVAGFQYYHGEAVWSQMQAGDLIHIARQPENRYDEMAIEVFWTDEKLGYIPRSDNVVIAQMLDRQQPLKARIIKLVLSSNPWERVGLEVWLDMQSS